MLLHRPVFITSRLLPGVRIGNATVSIDYATKRGAGGRTRYRYHIDLGRKHHTAADLESGVGGGSLQSGLETLLSFLGAAAESHGYHLRTKEKGEHEHLFPEWVNIWAYQHSDEISTLQLELEETSGLIRE